MGCTPSIHVNQTGVVFCRESEESNSHIASYSATYHAHIVKTESSGEATTSGSVTITGIDKQSTSFNKELFPLKQWKENVNIEAETQTSRLDMKVRYTCRVRTA